MKDDTSTPIAKGGSPNEFERGKPGTNDRSDAQAAIEELRQKGGVFVNAVRATRMPMVLTDPTLPGNPIVFANAAFLKLSGYKMDEVLGQQPHFMNGSDTDPKDSARFSEAIRADQDDIIETVQYRKNGSRFIATVLISAFKGDDGKVLNHFMSWLDVTRRVDAEHEVSELRNTQKALRESEAKYRGLFESIDEGFCVVDVIFDAEDKPVDYVFLEFNPAFERQTGMANALGKRMRELAPEHEQHWFDIYGRIALTGEPARFEQPAAALGRYYDVFAFRIGDPQRRHVAILFKDITERQESEAALRQSEAELEAELRRSTLLHGLSVRLVAKESLEEIYKEIASTAVAIAEADAGTVQIYEPATESLRLAATQGIDKQMAKYFQHVDARNSTVCGIALRTGERTVADFDADMTDASCGIHVNAGLRCAQSTPVLSRDRMPIGLISTHWRESGHRPNMDQLRNLDLVARLTADVIQQRKAEAALRKSEHGQVSALLAAEMGTWDYDLLADVCHFDARAQELYNLPSDQRDHRPEGVASVVHPDDVRAMFEEVQRASDPDGEGLYDMVYRIAGADGTYRWLRAVGITEFEGTGKARRAVRIVGASRDITLEREAETALRESEAKYRSLFEAMDEGYLLAQVITDERTGLTDILYLEANAAAIRIAGREFTGRRMRVIDPDYEEFWYELYARVASTGESSRGEHFAAPHDRWFAFYVFRVGDEQSRRVASIFQDVTERKREERLLRESGERQAFLLKLSDALRPLADAAAIQSKTARLVGGYLGVDRSMYAEVEGQRGSETGTIRGQYVRHSGMDGIAIGAFPDHFTFADFGEQIMAQRYRGEPLVVADIGSAPGFEAEEREAWRAANVRAAVVIPLVKEGLLVAEFGVHCAKARQWTEAEVDLLADVAERTWAAAQRARAEEALRESEHHAQILLAELQHRVRNTLAVVRSIARRTAENSGTVEDMLAHFQGRLDAFSRVQAALTRSPEGKVGLLSLIQDELVAHAAREGEQVEIDGTDLQLDPKTAERMSLAIHELTTNAVKHGALLNGSGRVKIRWRVRDKLFLLSWRESGLDLPPSPPSREGFGMELLSRSLPYDLRAETKVDLTPDGLHFELRMPLPEASVTEVKPAP